MQERTIRRLGVAALALTVVVGVVLRLHTSSELWLDEALTVNIARLPIDDLLEQLRHDGHPPLYYLLLHFWMELFGEGNDAVRLLSGAFGIATLPLLWWATRRWAGRAAALATLVLLATSPFAARYATETRMYSMVTFLVVAGWVLVRQALDRPTPLWLAAVAVLAGLLALTHYWAFYLLAATGLLLLWLWRRHAQQAALKVALSLVVGGVLFLPWLPSFLEQAGHTGTPWGRPERPTQIFFVSFTDWGGGPNGEAQMVGYGLLILVLLGLFARGIDNRRSELDFATVPGARGEATVAFLTMAIATVAGYASAAAFASRYTAVVFPLVLAIGGLGVATFNSRRIQAGILVVLALFGMWGMQRNARGERTQVGHLAQYIRTHGQPGDVVAFCPDQLGPSTMRLLPDTFVGMSFPDGSDPHFVDWVDYADRQKERTPAQFAAMIDAKATDAHTIWFVWAEDYRTVKKKCRRAVVELKKLRRGGAAVKASGPQFEHAWLYQYGPDPERGSP